MPLAPSCNTISDNTSVGFRVWHKTFGFPKSQQTNNWFCTVSGGRGVLHLFLAQTLSPHSERGRLSCAGRLYLLLSQRVAVAILCPSSLYLTLSVGWAGIWQRYEAQTGGCDSHSEPAKGKLLSDVCASSCLFIKPSSKPKRNGNVFLNFVKKERGSVIWIYPPGFALQWQITVD